MRRISIFILITVMILGTVFNIPAFAEQTKKPVTINMGDYVQMGTYYSEPILWRCVLDRTNKGYGNNNRLMLSDKIITIKPFDAKGEVHKFVDGTIQADSSDKRKNTGSGLWETSDLRMWLNSAEGAGMVKWIDECPPTAENVKDGYNAYADESGFLSDKNFTENERNAIMSVKQEFSPTAMDQAYVSEEENVSFNGVYAEHYFYSNRYRIVTDQMFLLTASQLDTLKQNSSKLESNYFAGQPTQKAVENSNYKDTALAVGKYWSTWLASLATINKVQYITPTGRASDEQAYQSNIGVRPAFYLDLSNIKFISGDGSKESPFVVDRGMKETVQTEKTDIQIAGQASNNEEETSTSISTEVCFKDRKIALTLPIQEVDGRTMYPLRECLEAMGATVTWDESTNTAYGELNANKVGFQIGVQTYTVNGIEHNMDVAPYIDDSSGRTYIPLRYAAEGLGFTVEWVKNENINKIMIQ